MNTFPVRMGIRQKCLVSPLLSNIVLEVLTSIRQGEEIKSIYIRKEETKLPLNNADNIIVYMENPKQSTHIHRKKKKERKQKIKLKSELNEYTRYRNQLYTLLYTLVINM